MSGGDAGKLIGKCFSCAQPVQTTATRHQDFQCDNRALSRQIL
jgi:hypothetical protein